MLQEYKAKVNWCVGLGIALQLLTLCGDSLALLGLIGFVLCFAGCCFYAKAKGYHVAYGLLGFLGILGLIVLVLLRDKTKPVP